MVKIIEHKGKKKTSYYMYDYILTPETKKYRKIYLGRTTQDAYMKYLKEKRMQSPYCKVCGKRFADTIPEYADKDKFQVCRCFK